MSLFGNIFAKGVRVAASTLAGASKAILVNLERGDPAKPSDLEKAGECVAFGPLGVYGRPEPPTAAQSGNLAKGECEALCARGMDGFEPLVYRDLRISRRMNPAVGELGMAHYGGGFVTLSWDAARSGTLVSISAPHLSGDEVDESHYLSLDPSDDGNSVILAHRSGHGLFLTKDGAAVISSPDGSQTFTVRNSGVVIGGKMSFVGGIVAGSTTLAEPVALAAAYEALMTLVVTCLAALAGNPLLTGTVTPAQLTELATRVALLPTAGKSTTLKASPT